MSKTISIPDNLDLAHRAQLGLNGLIGTCDPDIYYEPYAFTYYAARPAYFLHGSAMMSGVKPKFFEAYALLKCITGSPDTEHEKGFVKSILDDIEEDGFIYDRKDQKRPWHGGEDSADIAGNGRLANALCYMYQLTGEEIYKTALKRCAEKLHETAIIKDDYAYYPDSRRLKTGWSHTWEPQAPQEGAVTLYKSLPVRGLMKWYLISGDERMLDLSKRLINFVIKPRFYGGIVDVDRSYGAQRAHFFGYIHGNLAEFRGILDYACIANDMKALEFVRDGYEWLRQYICPQLGQDSSMESCCTGDLPAMAIQLTDAGMGDYWDDAEHFIRNATAQVQVTDLEGIRKIGESYAERPQNARFGAPADYRFTRNAALTDPYPNLECVDNVLERSIGGIANNTVDGRYQSPNQSACCTANALQGFYYAWEAAIRHNDGTSTVNLLFTRFSEWMDVISFLPYEGKIIIRNKTSRNINVRIPQGVMHGDVRLSINGNDILPVLCGRYVNITGLSGGEEIIITFPQNKRTLNLTLPSINSRFHWGYPKVTANFVGSTCIGLDDEGESMFGSESGSLLVKQFNEPKYRGGETVFKNAPYYVPPKIIKWY